MTARVIINVDAADEAYTATTKLTLDMQTDATADAVCGLLRELIQANAESVVADKQRVIRVPLHTNGTGGNGVS